MNTTPKQALPAVTLGALGIVFGDIGTSPLYAFAQCFKDTPGFAHDPAAITGALSLILWSILLVVCVKYTGFILRADHDGEGGTLALLGLLHARSKAPKYGAPGAMTLLVLFGSALLYGDGMVTPAISLLSATEGLEVISPAFKPAVVPLAVGILAALFAVQRLGTNKVGKLFGPVMLAWFVGIGVLGLVGIFRHPGVLVAFNPVVGLRLLLGHGWTGYAVMGAVVLCITGAEALFADLGHFGRRPILIGWYCVALPCLVLNYLGQGAMVLDHPDAASGPFFALVPHWALYPAVALATLATIIASQALISGVFSLTQQAINMGFAPRYRVIHTAEHEGQVYVPAMNLFLAVGCLALVLAFRSSDALGAAYGLAVVGTMVVTSITFFAVVRQVWRWSLWRAAGLVGCFIVVDCSFLGANLAKLFSGAWVPLAIAALVFGVATIWTIGRVRVRRALDDWAMPLPEFQAQAKAWERRPPGVAVFLSQNPDRVPLVGRHEWLRDNVSHEQVLLLRMETTRQPHVDPSHRFELEDLGGGIYRGVARFGFLYPPNIPEALSDLPFSLKGGVFFVPQPVASEGGSLVNRVLRRLFIVISQTAQSPAEHFALPPDQVVSVGLGLEY